MGNPIFICPDEPTRYQDTSYICFFISACEAVPASRDAARCDVPYSINDGFRDISALLHVHHVQRWAETASIYVTDASHVRTIPSDSLVGIPNA